MSSVPQSEVQSQLFSEKVSRQTPRYTFSCPVYLAALPLPQAPPLRQPDTPGQLCPSSSTPGFRTLRPLTLDQGSLLGGGRGGDGCPLHGKLSSSSPGLYPLDAGSAQF